MHAAAFGSRWKDRYDYQQTVLQANAEVEDGINDILKSQERLDYVRQAVNASQKSVDLAVTQYQQGAIDDNRVFNLLTAFVQDQDTLAIVQGNIANGLVSTYKSLGGGWEIRNGIRRGPMVMMIDEMPAPDAGTMADEPEAAQETNEANAGAAIDEDMLPPVPPVFINTSCFISSEHFLQTTVPRKPNRE